MDELQHLIFKREAEEVNRLIAIHSGPEKIKKVQAKKLMNQNFFCEIAFLTVLNFFQLKN